MKTMLRVIAITAVLGFGSVQAETIPLNQPGPSNPLLIEQLAAVGIEAFGETAGLIPDNVYFDFPGDMVRIRNLTDNPGSVAGIRLTRPVSAGTKVEVKNGMRRLMASSALEHEDLFEIIGYWNGETHVFVSRSSHEPNLLEWQVASFILPVGTPDDSVFILEATLTRVKGLTISGRHTSGLVQEIVITPAPVPLPSAILPFLMAIAGVALKGVRRNA